MVIYMKLAYITTAEILGPSTSGGIQCCKRNLSLLKQVFGEDNVHICAITGNKSYMTGAERNLTVFYSENSKLTSHLKYAFSGRRWFSKKTETAVIECITQLGCDFVFVESSINGFLQERLPKNLRQILFIHNVERVHSITRVYKQPLRLFVVPLSILNEAKAIKNADIVIALNARDSVLLQKYYNREADMILPVTFDDNFTPTEGSQQANHRSTLHLLFVGSLINLNEQGITWFIDNVMPHVNAELTVVGKSFEKRRDKLQRNNVNIIGSVDDLSQYYSNADAMVIPILLGGGMKVKTAEALMYGKPMFATNEALEGYEVEGLQNVYRCNTAEEYIEAINAYAATPPFTPVDMNIRKTFLEKYHTPSYASALRDLLLGGRSTI